MEKNGYTLWYAVSFAFQLGFMIAMPIIGFIFSGVLLDRKFHTHPIFLLFGTIAALGTTVYEVRHLLVPLIRHD